MRTNIIRLLLVGAVALASVLAMTATVGAKQGNKNKSGKAKVVSTSLKGKNEVPGPGDPDGKGKATIRLKGKQGEVCFRLRWRKIATPTAAHIHVGRKGEAGDVVVPLFEGTPVNKGCVQNVSQELIRQIRRHP